MLNDPSFEKSVKQRAQLDNDVLEGRYSYAPDEIVLVRQPRDNGVYEARGLDVPNYLEQGYRTITGEEAKAYEDAKKMGTLGKVGIAALDAADAIFLTVPKRIIKRAVSPQQGRVLEELENQSYAGDIGSAIGTALTLGEGLAAKPANALIKTSDEILNLISKKGISLEAGIASKAAKEGATSIAESIFKNVGGGLKKGAIEGLSHGVALAAPSATVEAAFGNTDEAAELLLIGGGLGAGFESIVGGTIGGVKSIKDILTGVKTSTDKIIKKVYGIDNKPPRDGGGGGGGGFGDADAILNGKLDEYTQHINESADKITKENLQRRLGTLETIGVSPYMATGEIVFQTPEQLATAKEVEKINIPFEGLKYQQERNEILSKIEQKTTEELGKKTENIAGHPDEVVSEIISKGMRDKLDKEHKPISDQYRAIEDVVADVKMSNPVNDDNLLFPIGKNNSYYETKKSVIKNFLSSRGNVETQGTTSLRNSIAKRMELAQDGKDWLTLMQNLRNERNEIFKFGNPSTAKMDKSKVYSKAIEEMEQGNILFVSRMAEETMPNVYPRLNGQHKDFMEKYGEILEELSGRNISTISDIREVLSDPLLHEKITDRFINNDKTYRNIKLHSLFPEQFKLATALKIRQMIKESSMNGVLNTRKLLNKINQLDDTTQVLMFGESGKALMSDLNHLLGGMRDISEAETKSITGDLIDAATSAGALVGSIAGGAGGAAVAVGAVKTAKAFKNILKVMRLNTEKEAIISAALSAEQELIAKNAGKAVKRGNEIQKEIKNWVNKVFDSKKFRLSKIVIPALVAEERRNEGDTKEIYEKNLDLIHKANAQRDFLKREMEDKANQFSKIPTLHINYLNKIDNALKELEQISRDQPVIKSKSFFKELKNIPSKNQMLKFNNQMKAFKNPFKIVEDFSNGIVNQDSIKIAEAVYPAITARIKKILFDKIVSSEELDISYNDRLKLSAFIGVNLDPSLSNINIFAQNSTMAQNQEGQQIEKQLRLKGNMSSPVQQIGEA